MHRLPASDFRCIGVIQQGNRLALGSEGGVIVLVETANGRYVQLAKSDHRIKSIAVSPRGDLLAVAMMGLFEGDRIAVYDVLAGKRICEYGDRGDHFDDILFSVDGSWLVIASFPKPLSDQELRIWQADPTPITVLRIGPPWEFDLLFELPGHVGGASRLTRARNRNIVLSCGHERIIRVWNLERGSRAGTLVPSDLRRDKAQERFGTISAVAVDETSTVAITATEFGTIQIWEVKTGNLTRTIPLADPENRARMTPPICLAVTPGRRTFLASHGDWRRTRLSEIDWSTGQILRDFDMDTLPEDFNEHRPLISSLVLTPDGSVIASCFYDELLLWNFNNGSFHTLIRGENLPPLAPNLIHERYPIALLPDARNVVRQPVTRPRIHDGTPWSLDGFTSSLTSASMSYRRHLSSKVARAVILPLNDLNQKRPRTVTPRISRDDEPLQR
jgi:WD40 repeat protein